MTSLISTTIKLSCVGCFCLGAWEYYGCRHSFGSFASFSKSRNLYLRGGMLLPPSPPAAYVHACICVCTAGWFHSLRILLSNKCANHFHCCHATTAIWLVLRTYSCSRKCAESLQTLSLHAGDISNQRGWLARVGNSNQCHIIMALVHVIAARQLFEGMSLPAKFSGFLLSLQPDLQQIIIPIPNLAILENVPIFDRNSPGFAPLVWFGRLTMQPATWHCVVPNMIWTC